MQEPQSQSRRWWRRVLWGVVLLLVAWSAWLYRPLNPTERWLLGYWKRVDGTQTMLFGRNRRFREQQPSYHGGWCYGSWSATENSISLQFDLGHYNLSALPWTTRLQMYCRPLFRDPPYELGQTGHDRILLHGAEYTRGER